MNGRKVIHHIIMCCFLSVFRCSSHLHTCSSACHLFNHFVQLQNLRNYTFACTHKEIPKPIEERWKDLCKLRLATSDADEYYVTCVLVNKGPLAEELLLNLKSLFSQENLKENVDYVNYVIS